MRPIPRRAVLLGLLGGAAWALAACSSDLRLPIPGLSDPDEDVKKAAADSERGLIATYDAVLAAVPALARHITGFRDQHRQHLAALAALGVDPSSSPSATGVPSVKGRADALRILRRAERRAAKDRSAACVAAEDSELAGLLARVGASESAHAAYLTVAVK